MMAGKMRRFGRRWNVNGHDAVLALSCLALPDVQPCPALAVSPVPHTHNTRSAQHCPPPPPLMATVPPPVPPQPTPPQLDASPQALSWEGEKMSVAPCLLILPPDLLSRFNIYIYDYCFKRGFHKTAHELMLEAEISPEPSPPINARQGLLFEYASLV